MARRHNEGAARATVGTAGCLLVALAVGRASAAPPPATAPAAAQAMTDQQFDDAARANVLNQQVGVLYGRGQFTEAIPIAVRVCDLYRSALGERHRNYATSLLNLGTLYCKVGRYAQAEPILLRAADVRRVVCGPGSPDYAAALNMLGVLYMSTGDDARAEPLCRRAMEIRRTALGERHPDYAQSLNNLGLIYEDGGDYDRAEPMLRTAMEIRRAALGERHADYAVSVNNLAFLYENEGDYARAEPLYRKSMEINRAALGERHPDYATSLNNLGLLYRDAGDDARAEPLIRNALDVRRATLGERHPDYGRSLVNLASVYDDTGDFARAEPLFSQAAEVVRSALGARHPDYATSLEDLALVRVHRGDFAGAEPLYRQAMDIRRDALGEHHPDYARSLTNLGRLREQLGDPAGAEPLFRQALEIRRSALGERSPAYADSLCNLAVLYEETGDPARAEPLSRAALAIVARQADRTAAVRSEADQLRAAGGDATVDIYLNASARTPADDAYSQVLSAKGRVALRQQAMRAARAGLDKDPAVVALREQLAAATRDLSRRSRVAPPGTGAPSTLPATARPDAGTELDALSDRVDRLQRELAARDAGFRQARDQLHRTSADVAAALPADAVLVDVRQYHPWVPSASGRKGFDWGGPLLTAFVVHHGQPAARVELGPAAAVEAAVDQWRRTLGSGAAGVAAGATLRQLVWQPLLDHAGPQMAGATTVLLSPDGPLCRFPMAALPGEKPGTYLVEDVAVGEVAVPAALPDMLARATPPVAPTSSLLLVGDVDYGAAPTAPPDAQPSLVASAEPLRRAAARSGAAAFAPLPQTQAEVATVRDQFEDRFPDGKVVRLRRGQATVSAVSDAAAHARWIHIATHGFFADPAIRSATDPAGHPSSALGRLGGDDRISGYHPGLLSGIALAGANAPTPADDGILTALEMEELDLSGVDLAVLSACDTGLGRSAGGEGLLGLQRSLQVAGARTVIASLWSVDDGATRDLMIHFYRAMWAANADGTATGKLAALRAAQLQLLHEGIGRGLASVDAAKAAGAPDRLPPRYWAAFVLSGDWR
jgi:CHAT domain-containing protein/tetratricopeptide (TPR) repeat protein